jgi:hypothetical protein
MVPTSTTGPAPADGDLCALLLDGSLPFRLSHGICALIADDLSCVLLTFGLIERPYTWEMSKTWYGKEVDVPAISRDWLVWSFRRNFAGNSHTNFRYAKLNSSGHVHAPLHERRICKGLVGDPNTNTVVLSER